VDTYILHCDCQPISLFGTETLSQNFETYNPEIIYSIIASALRFSKDPFLKNEEVRLTAEYASAAQRLIMSQITAGRVELSTLQALCLHAFISIGGIIWYHFFPSTFG